MVVYDVVLVFSVQQSELAMCVYVCCCLVAKLYSTLLRLYGL